MLYKKGLKAKKRITKPFFAPPTDLGAEFCRACFFLTAARKPGRGAGAFAAAQGRARRGAPFCARRYAKAVSKKRRGRVYAGRGKRCGRLGSVSAVLSSCQLCAHICFAHNFGGALAPLGSPPGRLPLSNYSGAEFCRACFFLTAVRKTGARRGGFCRRARLYYHLRI